MSEKILTQQEKNYTVEEYLKFERNGANKHEFMNGKIIPTAASSRQHSLIGSNTTIAVGGRLRGHKCEIYVNNMRVKLNADRFCYPDVVIVSGEPVFDGRESDVLLNPTVIVDIFSKTNRNYDKSEKLELFLAMDSVRDCLLIKEDEMRVEHYAKQTPKQWMYRIYTGREEVISLESITCKVTPAEIYAQVRFEPAEVKLQATG